MSTRWETNYFVYYIKTYGSHEMLHHAETKLFFCLMHMFELFQFELGACLNLNPKEKKTKGIRNFIIKEKMKEAWNLSLLGPSGPSGPRGACYSPLPALSAGWARPVGAGFPCLRACVLYLSCGPRP
jgi:hypothetical protein